jgi:ribose/xylose/arabinose/galactoside ABC-type transport system permease subunit
VSLSKIATTQSSLRWRGFQEVFALLLILALIVLVMSQLSSAFMTGRNLSNLLLDATTVGIIAVFSTMLMISGGLDLSVASNAALCGVVIGVLQEPLGLLFAVLIALATGILVGFINGFVVTYIGINPLIATLGMLSVARGLAFVFANGLTIPVFDLTGENPAPYLAFAKLSEGRFLGLAYPVWLMLALFVIGFIILRQTSYGRAMYAIGGNEEASRLAALPVKRYRMWAYTLSGFSAALAAILLTSRLYAADPKAAPNIELTVITAIVLGGTSLAGGQGGLVGTFLGVFVLGTLLNGLNLQSVSTEFQNIAQGLVLLLAVGIDQLRQGNIRLRRNA